MAEHVREIEWREYEDVVDDADAERPVVAVFRADWCEFSRELDAVVETLAEEYEGQVDVVSVDLDEEGRLANEQNIYDTPTVVGGFRGNRLKRIDGARSAAELEELFDYLVQLPRAA
ncbi:MAG: thioredoxin family protein [Bradymonadaceae bacterium]